MGESFRAKVGARQPRNPRQVFAAVPTPFLDEYQLQLKSNVDIIDHTLNLSQRNGACMKNTDGLIDRIYEAALVPGQWTQLMEDLAAAAGCQGGLMVSARDHVPNKMVFTDGMEELCRRASTEGWWERNTRGKVLLSLPSEEFHSDADHFSMQDMSREPVYRDLLWPLGMGYAAATHIQIPNGDTLILSLERMRDLGPVPADAIDGLTRLRPHIARSALLASRLSFARIQSANEAFGKTGMPSAAVNRVGKVIDSNTLFQERFDQTPVGAGDRLRLCSAESNRVLDECLAAAQSGNDTVPMSSRSIALPSTEKSQAAVLHLVPVAGHARDIFTSAAFFVILTPLDASRLAPIELIQGLFDLTTSEARVARALAAGNDIGTIARNHGVARETVRAHLKSIFAKTGFSRQTDLATAVSLVRTVE
jgi:DNA-binding CsgD family transcriptional regulator